MKKFETFEAFAKEFGVMDTPIMRRIYEAMREREEDVLVTRIRELVTEGIEDYDFEEIFRGIVEDYDFDFEDDIEEAVENSCKIDDMESEISDLQDAVYDLESRLDDLGELDSEDVSALCDRVEELSDKVTELEDYVRNVEHDHNKIMRLLETVMSREMLEKFDLI